VNHAIPELVCFSALGKQLQVLDHLTQAWARLMRIHDAREDATRLLPLSCYGKEILVLREQHSMEFRGAFQHLFIIGELHAIFLRRSHIHASSP
jgi:hypothetical protein